MERELTSAPAPPVSGALSRPTFACVRCAERKVKCDRERPCSACVKHKVDCVYQPPRPPQRRARHIKEQILVERLRQCELLLKKHGISLEDSSLSEGAERSTKLPPNEGPAVSDPSPPSEHGGNVSRPHIIQGNGRSMLVNNSLWSRVAEEFYDPEDALQDSTGDESEEEASANVSDFVLTSEPKRGSTAGHPPGEHILHLWRIFREHVDPLTKTVHVPSLEPTILKASTDVSTLSRSVEALLFSIYSASVMSLSKEACEELLGEARGSLLRRYVTLTSRALSRAKFMSTTDIVVLQALILHLLSIREVQEPRAVWSLTGVAVRIGQAMGLDRDGASLGLPPFETEMRRRIWWQLKTLDNQIAEICGLSKFRDHYIGPDSTRIPRSLNDSQLHPGMPELPDVADALTDMAFVSLRYELIVFATKRVTDAGKQDWEAWDDSRWEQQVASEAGSPTLEQILDELVNHLETKYLRYCDPSQPLHLITMLLARSAIGTIQFMAHHPRKWGSVGQIPAAERPVIWDISIKLLEQHNMLQSNPQLKQFAWNAAFVMQWHALIHVLDTLRVDPLTSGADKAWNLIQATYDNNQAMAMDKRKPIHVAVAGLCLKAFDARQAAMPQGNEYGSAATVTPAYILRLREQQSVDAAKKCDPPLNQRLPGPHPTTEKGPLNDTAQESATFTMRSNPLTLMQAPDRNATVHAVHIDSGQTQAFDLTTHSRTDQDHGYDFRDLVGGSNTILPASWDQWDTWLTESNTMYPFTMQEF